MKEEPNNKCKESGLVHAWRDITENIIYPTMPPQYPPKKEQCQNCGLIRTDIKKTESWYEYKMKKLPKPTRTFDMTDMVDSSGTGGVSVLVDNSTSMRN